MNSAGQFKHDAQGAPAIGPRMQRGRAHNPMMRCPVCGACAFARTSEELTPTVRQLYYYCGNIACSMTWKSMLSIVSVISPSGVSPEFRIAAVEETKPPGHAFGQMSLLDLCRDGGDDPPA